MIRSKKRHLPYRQHIILIIAAGLFFCNTPPQKSLLIRCDFFGEEGLLPLIKLLYEDKYKVIAEKPAAMLSEPSAAGEDIVTALSAQLGTQCFLVHRLDRGTGGAMLLAKTSRSAGELCRLVQEKDAFIKEYLAVVKGTPESPEGRFEDLLFKDSQKNKVFIVKRERKGVKKAALEYRVLKALEHGGEACSLVLVRLITGRTHQIRVQFAGRKMPLLGDGKYGSRDNRCETALWSFRLSFSDPQGGKTVCAKSFPPKEYPWSLFDIENLVGTED